MLMSTATFIEENKDKSYEELIVIRDQLIDDIRYYETHADENEEMMRFPSPRDVYLYNLEYLVGVCELISKIARTVSE